MAASFRSGEFLCLDFFSCMKEKKNELRMSKLFATFCLNFSAAACLYALISKSTSSAGEVSPVCARRRAKGVLISGCLSAL